MIFKYSRAALRRYPGMNGLLVLLLMLFFMISMLLVTSVELKLKPYIQVSGLLKEKGFMILSHGLYHPDTSYNLKDVQEIKAVLPKAKDVWTVSEVWGASLSKLEESRDDPDSINLWCYNDNVVDTIKPRMRKGRWFRDSDKTDSTLKGVVCANGRNIKTGDKLTIYDTMMDVQTEIEIIGVMEDGAKLFFHDAGNGYCGDYTDLYYTYDYRAEGKIPVVILLENQITDNADKGWFPELNFRLSSTGFHKNVTSVTVVTYPENVVDDEIQAEIDLLKKYSFISHIYKLGNVRKNSIQYIREDVYRLLPIAIGVFLFILVATVCMEAVTVRNSMKKYAIYYICGMQWRQCFLLCLLQAAILAGTAFFLLLLIWLVLWIKHSAIIALFHWGLWQIASCLLLMLLYVALSGIIPAVMLGRTSAKKVLYGNGYF